MSKSWANDLCSTLSQIRWMDGVETWLGVRVSRYDRGDSPYGPPIPAIVPWHETEDHLMVKGSLDVCGCFLVRE